MTAAQASAEIDALERDYTELGAKGLALDLTRGKPAGEQLDLASDLDGMLAGDYRAADGTDVRNYGGLVGLPEARALFGSLLGVPAEETLVGGNASLTLMYNVLDLAVNRGLRGADSAWRNSASMKFLCPVPGYDRHFTLCESLGIDMLPVPMLETGPDMDAVEALVDAHSDLRGIWCVPRFSNPTGCVYNDATVKRIAQLPNRASSDFIVMWDNAYAVHTLNEAAPELASIRTFCLDAGTLDHVFQFGSTSKITFAGAGVGYTASSVSNLAALQAHLGVQSISPDKVNQLRHVRLLPDRDAVIAHMASHRALLQPKFDAVLSGLEQGLGGRGMGTWTHPRGGYFVSFDSRPGLASGIVTLAADIGVKLTPAGATFPYGEDPSDCNIRLAPSYPSLQEVSETVTAFVVCVKLASLRQKLAQGATA